MKSRKKLILIIVSILLIALILNAIFTWGIIFHHHGGFGSSTTSLFEDITDSYAQVRLGGNLNNPIIYIPLVFYVYGIEPPPYTINLEISDERELFEKIFIERIYIEYVGGHKVSHNIDWERTLKDSPVHRFIDAKLIEFPAKQLYDKIPVTVSRRESCRIRFVGHFVDKEGKNVSFETVEYFEYEAHKWSIYPLAGSF